MIDFGSLASLAGSLKSASEIAKALIDLRDTAAIQSKVIELQGVILSAQSGALAAQSNQSSMLEQIRELEAKVAQLEAWASQKKRYQLTEYGGGTFAYALKKEASDGEPDHRICPTCFENGHRSILQFQVRNYLSQDVFHCARCKVDIGLGVPRVPRNDGGNNGGSWMSA